MLPLMISLSGNFRGDCDSGAAAVVSNLPFTDPNGNL